MTTVTLIILTGLLLVLGMISYSLTEIKDRVDVSVYLKTSTAEGDALALKAKILENDRVEKIDYISGDDALAAFKRRHAGDEALIASLSELPENPLSPTLRVKAKDLSEYPMLVEQLQTIEGNDIITKVNFEDNKLLIDRLSRMLTITATGGAGLLLAFALLAILVNFNTVALAIYHRREEVEIMRLVGATNWYIRGPFLVEALIYSALATIITSFAVVPLYLNALPRLASAFGLDPNFTGFFTLPRLILMQLVLALIISSTASLLAIRKYLKT